MIPAFSWHKGAASRQAGGIVGGVLIGIVSLLAGCAHTPDAALTPVGANPNLENGMLSGSTAKKELVVAKGMVRAGDYSQVIPRLSHLTSKYPNTGAGIEGHYYLGLTYYRIGGYREALDHFREYLDRSEDGHYADICREYVAGLSDQAPDRYLSAEQLQARTAGAENTTGVSLEIETKRIVTLEQLQAQIQAVQKKAEAEPNELTHQLELANLYWRTSQYDEAGKLYARILSQWPQLHQDATIRRRIEFGPNNTYTVLTPRLVEERAAEAEPLLVINTQSYRSGRYGQEYRLVGKDIYYHVTGEVVNRGSEALRDVRVIITIYGFGNLVYDTRTCGIGTVRPGERRAFSARFSDFDDINNVDRYECVGLFQQ